MVSRAALLTLLLVGVSYGLKVKDENPSLLEAGVEGQSEAIPFQEIIFKFIDRNKDGFLSLDDLKKSIHFRETAKVFMDLADKNGDQKLSKLEFFGTVQDKKGNVVNQAGSPKVPGDAGSGPKAWHNRDFDPVLDMNPGQKYPELCSKEFWQWAAIEWSQRKVDSKVGTQAGMAAGWEERVNGGNYEPMNFNPEHYLMYQQRSANVGVPAQWDVCLRLLPIQKRLKMTRANFNKWLFCYNRDLKVVAEKEDHGGLVSGLPRNTVSRQALSDFYTKYHVGDGTTCGMSAKDVEDAENSQKVAGGCYWYMSCWTDPQKWVPQKDGEEVAANCVKEDKGPPLLSRPSNEARRTRREDLQGMVGCVVWATESCLDQTIRHKNQPHMFSHRQEDCAPQRVRYVLPLVQSQSIPEGGQPLAVRAFVCD